MLQHINLANFFANPASAISIIEAAGEILWILAYALIIRIGFKHRSYGVPMLALCMNVTWEFLRVFVKPPTEPLTHVLFILWLALDAVILFQLLRYGRRQQPIPEVRDYFPWIIGFGLAASFAGHWLFQAYFQDPGGGAEAYLMNLLMSGLFIHMYATRPDATGLSLGAAWAKMGGSWLQAAGMQIKTGAANEADAYAFITYLQLVILILDITYIVLLHRRRKKLREAGTGADL